LKVICSSACRDAKIRLLSQKDIGTLLVDWDKCISEKPEDPSPIELISMIRERNRSIPIFIISDKKKKKDIPSKILGDIQGIIPKEDTPISIAQKIKDAIIEYREKALLPFFPALVTYFDEYKYSWSTPGHAGGAEFRVSVPARAFFDFFGENIFRSDLSSSMP